MRRPTLLMAILLAAACDSSVGSSSAYLDPIENADDPRPGVPGERCNLATFNEGESFIRLVAFQDAAVVRIDGEPVRIAYRGGNLRAGGTFQGDGLEIQVGGISDEMARLAERAGVPAVVSVRSGDSVENFEGVWTCGIMRPEPAPAAAT